MNDSVDAFEIERGWRVLTGDGHRVGDVIEVHPTYLLVSRGVILVSDTYVPLHAVEKAEDGKVHLALDRAAFKRMDWKKPPRTPLELLRPKTADTLGEDDVDDTDDGFAETAWATPNDDEPAATEPYDYGTAPEPDYWEPATSTDEIAEDYEGYNTLGVVTNAQLEVEGGIKLAIQDVGHGRPIILLHDWLLGQAYWDGLLPRLVEEGHRVITMDLRGHGSSDRPWDEYWPSLHVHDLRTLVRTLDLQEPTIVGHGLGAAIAVQYATTHPRATVRRLILVAPAAPRFTIGDDWTSGQEPETVDAWLERLRVDRPALVRHLLGGLLPAASLDDATVQWLWELAMRPPTYSLIQTLRALSTLDLREDLAALRAPLTVLQGTEDRFTPPSVGRTLAMTVPGAEYLPFEGVGHLLGLEARAVFEETLLGLLTRDAEEDSRLLMASLDGDGLPEVDGESESDAPALEDGVMVEQGGEAEVTPGTTPVDSARD